MTVQTSLTVLLKTTLPLQQSKRKKHCCFCDKPGHTHKTLETPKHMHGSVLINLLVNHLVNPGINIMLTMVTFWQLSLILLTHEEMHLPLTSTLLTRESILGSTTKKLFSILEDVKTWLTQHLFTRICNCLFRQIQRGLHNIYSSLSMMTNFNFKLTLKSFAILKVTEK